jgi:hypothetical protein
VRERTAALFIGCRFGRFRPDVVVSLRRTARVGRPDGVGRLVHERDPRAVTGETGTAAAFRSQSIP